MVEHTMDVTGWLRKHLEEASPDLLRVMVKDFAEALMSADTEAVRSGEDTRFLWTAGADVDVHDDDRKLVVIVHAGNRSPKRTDDSLWTQIPIDDK